MKLVCLVAALAGATLAFAQPAAADFKLVRTVGDITEYRLPANGLTVLLLEDHSAPVATLMVTYRVGSRHEVTGTTGAAHLLEHLMFKGSKNFHPGIGKGFDTVMNSIGADYINATARRDATNYYATLPANQLALAIELEADRMRGALLREEDRRPEMTVVRNEFERGENNPLKALEKEVTAAAFIAHPYRHPIIGWRSDIENMPIEKLREFYDAHYRPDNAVVTVVGDFPSARVLDLLARHFGPIPRATKPIPTVYTKEPAQTGPRRVVVRRPGEVGIVQLAFKVPHARHTDHAPLEALAAVLSEGKTSRLYRGLIDTNLATDVYAWKEFSQDDFLFFILASLAPGTGHAQAEQALLAALEKIRGEGVTPAETERAVNKILTQIAFQRDGSFAQASLLNDMIVAGDWTLYHTRPERLKAVTADDVRRVAQSYLVADASTTGWFVPRSDTPGAAAAPVSADGPAGRPLNDRDPAVPVPGPVAAAEGVPAGGAGTAAKIGPRVKRREIAGLDVQLLRTSIRDVVTIQGSLAAGGIFNPPDNPAVADLAAGLLDLGTVRRDKFAISELLERAGATLQFQAGSHTLDFSAQCLRRDLPLVLALLGEQLRTPRFDPAEFAKLKQQRAGEFRRTLEDPDARALRAFERAVFPPGHPNRPTGEDAYLAAIESATLAEVRAFHAAHYGPAGGRLVLVGDIDAAAAESAIREAFGGWAGGRPFPAARPAPALAAARTERIDMPGKTSVSVLIGQPSFLRYRDPEYQALRFATAVLGSDFFSARLNDIVRNREGLTYSITAKLAGDAFGDGSWQVRATFAPELLGQGLESSRRELRRFRTEGIGAAELAAFKLTLGGSARVSLGSTTVLAKTLLWAAARGYGPEWLDDYPERVEALTLDEVNAAIRKYLDPDRMVTVLAGSLPDTKK